MWVRTSQYERDIHQEVKVEIKKKQKEIADFWKKQEVKKEDKEEWVKGECAECYEYKKVSLDSGLCRKCEKEAEKGYSEDE